MESVEYRGAIAKLWQNRGRIMNVYPSFRPGDEIRVVAPSTGWQRKRVDSYDRATRLLEGLGFRVSFGRNIRDTERFLTGSVAARLEDFHDAYRDTTVKAIMALHGGWSANAVLPGIDWQLVAANPKPLIGFSDVTVLLNALYAQTGRVQYLGPNFASLGHVAARDYSLKSLMDILTSTDELQLRRSRAWERERGKALAKTRPWKVLQKGTAEGVLLGGNLGTFYLLQGTPYQPQFDEPTILAVEDDDEAGVYSAREFERRFASLLQLPGMRQHLCGLLVGRFQPSSKVTMPDIIDIVRRAELGTMPVIADVDFGHTWPMLTLPIGGTVSISTKNNQPQFNLLKY